MDLGEEPEEREPAPTQEAEAGPSEPPGGQQDAPTAPTGYGPGAIAAAYRAVAADATRARSPTPPRALYRSTTGKGVAFTDEDVIFLVRFLEYRTRQQDGKLDMVTFWKDVAAKVFHSRRILLVYVVIKYFLTGSSSLAGVVDEVL